MTEPSQRRLRTPSTLRRLGRTAGSVVVLAFVAGGCQLGERPTLGPAPAESGDPSTEAVLAGLDDTPAQTFTAEYAITAPAGGSTTATVVQEGPDQRRVTIATTEFVIVGTTAQTCDTTSGACRPGLDPQSVSNYGISPEFFSTGAAARLRRDAVIRVGPTAAADETIAGQLATCVTVPIEDTASVFCTLEHGPLARWRTTDVTIELTSFTSSDG